MQLIRSCSVRGVFPVLTTLLLAVRPWLQPSTPHARVRMSAAASSASLASTSALPPDRHDGAHPPPPGVQLRKGATLLLTIDEAACAAGTHTAAGRIYDATTKVDSSGRNNRHSHARQSLLAALTLRGSDTPL